MYHNVMKKELLYDVNTLNDMLELARKLSGGYRNLAERLGANSGAVVQMWTKNGIPHKWRPILIEKFGYVYETVKKAEKKIEGQK